MRKVYRPGRNGLGIAICVCDSCGEEEQYTFEGEIDYQEWCAELRADGWTNVKHGDIWHNYCKNCSRQRKNKK